MWKHIYASQTTSSLTAGRFLGHLNRAESRSFLKAETELKRLKPLPHVPIKQIQHAGGGRTRNLCTPQELTHMLEIKQKSSNNSENDTWEDTVESQKLNNMKVIH